VGVKPAGLSHTNLWGSCGLLVFTAKLSEESAGYFRATEPGWTASKFDPAVTALVRACLAASSAKRREEAVVDLLALRTPSLISAGTPPVSLDYARQAIMEEPQTITIVEAAEIAGLHRVRFSMLFREYYGIAPSLYRLRALTARAIRDIAEGEEGLSGIAHRVGFSDQAHMTRSVQRTAGLSPGRLRSLIS
jgi:AraC-like DNA-binding protein